MKNLLIPAAFAFLFTACDKAKVDVDFNLDIADVYFVIDTNSTTGNVTLATTSFASTLQQELTNHDASIDDVETVEVTAVEFVHLNPQNFDVVDRAYSYIIAGGLPEQRIAYKDPIADGLTLLQMDVDAVNLKDHLASPTVNLRVDGFLSAPNLETDSIRARLSFRIHASVKPS